MTERQSSRGSQPSREELRAIITRDDGTPTLVDWADSLGRALKNANLTTNQIRALFGEVRQIQGEWPIRPERAYRRLILLKPKMAYRARKERGQGVQMLVDVLAPAVDFVIGAPGEGERHASFQRFVEFFEAILAYHKAYGGS